MNINLVQLPTLALELEGYDKNPIGLNNIYNRVMPVSLPRVSAIIKNELGTSANVEIEDLRIANPQRKEFYKQIDWEGYKINAYRVGAAFSSIDDKIRQTDWIGISSHFTFESGIVEAFIEYAKRVNPKVKIMVGGADAKAQPQKYIEFGADLVFTGDVEPSEIKNHSLEARIVGPSSRPFMELINPDFASFGDLTSYIDGHDGPLPKGVNGPVGFIYFTRGCARECDFCESRQSKYESLDLENSIRMLENYQRAGIRTLNVVDDNLLLQSSSSKGRQKLIDLFCRMKEMGFAWEFPNGLEVGMLAGKGVIDKELMDALFYRSGGGNVVGAYRMYFPIETFDKRGDYSKLKKLDVQNLIIADLAKRQIPEVGFGVIIFPEADEAAFETIERNYSEIKRIVDSASHGATKARYGIFHLIPIGTYRAMQTKFNDPELWNFYTPVYDGKYFTAGELFRRRMELTRKLDPVNFTSMMKGSYGYG